MIKINSSNAMKLLIEKYNAPLVQETPLNAQEIELADKIKELIDGCVESSDFQIETTTELDYENEEEPISLLDDEDESESDESETVDEGKDITPQTSQASSASYQLSPITKKMKTIDFEMKKRAVNFWREVKTKPHWDLESVNSKFRFVDTEDELYLWEKQIKTSGSMRDKLKQTKNHALTQFQEGKRRGIPIHDLDLKRWALRKRDEIECPNLKASFNWLLKFKRNQRIVSRKITKFVTRTITQDCQAIVDSADNFVKGAKPKIQKFGFANVFNTDQSGFNLEYHSGRTLEHKEAKKIHAVVQSVSSTTHSYTIQPTVSADGELLSPLFIVLKEDKGEFGPTVKKKIFKERNIMTHASTSGKMTKHLLQIWYKEAFFPKVGKESLLLVDSWTGFNDQAILENAKPKRHKLETMTIPQHTTGIVQPLDMFGFRTWKNFGRHFSDQVLIQDIHIILNQRNNILKLQSIIHNQFCSPRYKNFLKYAWFKSGYINEKPPPFDTPIEFSFNIDFTNCNLCDNCGFLRCGWCKNTMF